ncbi:uncharacterized protein LOC128771088 [Synchiropus splendidus]|uniref:uncharacterized protein LOC128771088 n=1 Tax=Synchiropus splendidus TaxID=270530 RepID=UPI00237E86EF|nr:uncharacterized protein LOC128771088 [Synchiropus splendidus]XP_053742198.1 uncharacterized protein LOC128771088 [Synchiropus splendidus]
MEEASLLEAITTFCWTVNQTAMRAQSNKERCQSLGQRVRSLEAVVLAMKEQGHCHMTSVVIHYLNELLDALTAAEYLMRKYSKSNVLMDFLKSSSNEEKFRKIDQKMRTNLELLCAAMHLELGDTNHIYRTIDEGTHASGTAAQPSSTAASSALHRIPARTVATPFTRPPAAIPLTTPPPAAIPLTTPPPAAIPIYSPVPQFMPMPTVVHPMMPMVSPGTVSYISSGNPLLAPASSASIYVPSAHNYFGPTVTPLQIPCTGVTQTWTVPLSPQNTVVTTPINYVFR